MGLVQGMKRLVCSKCGFKTNAVAEEAINVLCAGCHKNPKVTWLREGGLRDAAEAALIDHENLPDYLKVHKE